MSLGQRSEKTPHLHHFKKLFCLHVSSRCPRSCSRWAISGIREPVNFCLINPFPPGESVRPVPFSAKNCLSRQSKNINSIAVALHVDTITIERQSKNINSIAVALHVDAITIERQSKNINSIAVALHVDAITIERQSKTLIL